MKIQTQFLGPVQQEVREPVHHMLLVDRSGSMSWAIKQLIQQVSSILVWAEFGDSVSFGWFSSEGQYSFPIKVWKIETQDDLASLQRQLKSYASTIGLTCFREILNDARQVVDEAEGYNVHTLWFFTDGCPVVSNYTVEKQGIKSALQQLSSVLARAIFVGYGTYYNRELMGDMALWAQGSLYHASEIQQSIDALENSLQNGTVPKQQVELVFPPTEDMFYFENGSIVRIDPAECADGYALVSATAEKIVTINFDDNMPMSPSIEKDYYAAAAYFSQRGQKNKALQVLALTGDIALIDQLNNAFTLEEMGEVEKELLLVANGKPGGELGYDFDYLPKPDAFCVLNALALLIADSSARFYPQHPAFEYKRISPKAVYADGYPKFVPDQKGAAFSNLVWNKSRLNLSILFRTTGTVDIGKDAEALGLQQYYPSFRWNNYAIIQDGNLWTNKLAVTCSRETYEALREHGVVLGGLDPVLGQWQADTQFVLDLGRLPVINQNMASFVKDVSAETIAKLALDEYHLECSAKAIKFYLSKFDEEQDGFLTVEQAEYLASKGLKPNGEYNPPSTAAEKTDIYQTHRFQIKLAGLSSIPKVEDVLTKVDEEEKVTASQRILGKKAVMYRAIYKNGMEIDEPRAKEMFESFLKNNKEQLQDVRQQLAEIRFGIMKGGYWPFPSRQEDTVVVDGIKATFSVDVENVKI